MQGYKLNTDRTLKGSLKSLVDLSTTVDPNDHAVTASAELTQQASEQQQQHHHHHHHGSSKERDDPGSAMVANQLPEVVAIPNLVVPLYQLRQVLLKIGDNFLRVGTGSTPVISKLRPPLRPRMEFENEDSMTVEEVLRGLGRRKRKAEEFNYQDFVFLADESATLKASWYHHAKAFFNIRLGIKRGGDTNKTNTDSVVYLAVCPYPDNSYEVKYDRDRIGCNWWNLTAVNHEGYLATPLRWPNRCLTRGPLGLCLSPPLTPRDRARIATGVWDPARTLTILSLPEFLVWRPAVTVD